MTRPTTPWKGRLVVLGLASSLFLSSLALPALAVRTSEHGKTELIWGGMAALLGGLAVLAGQPAWLANPALAVGVILLCLRAYVASAIVSLLAVAVAVALCTLTMNENPLPADEAGAKTYTLLYPHVGFAAWVASMLALAVGATVLRLNQGP